VKSRLKSRLQTERGSKPNPDDDRGEREDSLVEAQMRER
jgi:hypothetical protein